jgi:hypothetical protein
VFLQRSASSCQDVLTAETLIMGQAIVDWLGWKPARADRDRP